MYDYRVSRENTDRKPVAIVLGGTIPHGELIQQLSVRGFYTILIDYFDNPPAAKYADIHYRESAMDYRSVLNISRENNAQVIMSSCLDQQMNIAMKAAEELGITHPFSSELALKVTNKKLMKKIMMEGDIPTSKYYVADENTNLRDLELEYPIIVKPVDSCGSAGVIKLETEENFKIAVHNSMKWANSSKVIVEEFVDGTEMSVHGYVKEGEAHILFGTCKITAMQEKVYQQLCNVYIPRLRPNLQKKLEQIANQIVDEFELPAFTPMFMQVIVKEDKVSVIEFSPRIAGGIASYIARECAGFDLMNYSIDSYLGIHTVCDEGKLEGYACCYPLYCRDGIFQRVEGYEELLKDGTVKKMLLLKESGDHIDISKPSSSNVMKYVIEGNTPEECFEKIQRAGNNTEIYDEKGVAMRDHRFILTKELFDEKMKMLIG